MQPALPELLSAALALGMSAEVFSNLVHVLDRLWPLLRRRG
jgi:hypothetical protein